MYISTSDARAARGASGSTGQVEGTKRIGGLADVALGDAIGIRGDGAGIAADADRRARGALSGRRIVRLEDLLAERAIALLDEVGVDRGRAGVAADRDGAWLVALWLVGREVVLEDLLADAEVALADRVGVEREGIGRAEESERVARSRSGGRGAEFFWPAEAGAKGATRTARAATAEKREMRSMGRVPFR